MDLAEQLNQVEANLREVVSQLEMLEKERAELLSRQDQLRLQLRQQARRDARKYTTKITSYAWDQSDTYVKIYLTLKGVHEIPPEDVAVTFTDRSFSVLVRGLEGKDHQMAIANLLCAIDPEGSFKKIKSNLAVVMCKKRKAKQWDYLTQVEKQSKEKKNAKPDMDEYNDADPGRNLMNLMQKMYSEGDDEMKRTINKVWAESEEKRRRGEGLADF